MDSRFIKLSPFFTKIYSACSEMRFENTYGELGCSSWEIPALIKNEIAFVSDSDGVSYPWYGSGSEIATIKGPCPSYSELTVKYD